ncbi:hypothetical protein Mp_4g19130 [Marchantia polymorpha subsp. ruderalis]|uniref:Uncharacterized protein n=2 Tax=Marchantia polymorpha TaxID=3197 RepID=A0AAF6BBH4_MARPO|nr:hypothetical protein MARPO_0164s0001 [Marchantia polymorpha]BBN09358.1 hypothetical protein Mp_4g19130 [Marchantia polymorpha subsp. ruderalis]|eukprot:PTQ28402.1 hypothetical protein MARPO_0164s0001 [Marchantia polymorpha]
MTSELTMSVSVYHRRKDGALKLYDRKTTDLILDAAARGEASVSFTKLLRRRVVDLQTMKQRKWWSNEEEDIVIEISWSPESLQAAEAFSGMLPTRTKILEMAILRITEEKLLSKVLDLKRVPLRSIRPNPYLGRGHGPFDSFVSSLENDRSAKELYDAALQLASDPTDSAVGLLQTMDLYIIFHGTNHNLMDNILKNGLLPNFRGLGRMEDWFGLDYRMSLHYTRSRNQMPRECHSGCKLLVFMVLRPDFPSYAYTATSCVSGNQLPLAELTLL